MHTLYARIASSIFIVAATFNTFFTEAQIPANGSDTLLDVGTWNLEWLGSSEGGPSNEQLQFNNVKTVLNNTDIDVWGVCELSSDVAFNQLLAQLPQYGGVQATFAQTQKTALFYKEELFDVVSSRHILASSSFNYNFAGRPPLEVVLATKAPLPVDTIHFLVLHFKAFDDFESYTRRKEAAIALKDVYLDNNIDKKFIVLGDWNDDLDESIHDGVTTPFSNFIDDEETYLFATQELSENGYASYAFYSGSFLDHILLSKHLFSDYLPEKTKVLNNMPTYISGYTNNTSDHYPVITSFKFGSSPTVGIENTQFDAVKLNVTQDGNFIIATGEWSGDVEVVNVNGQTIGKFTKSNATQTAFSIESLQEGLYFVYVNQNDRVKSFKFIK